MKIVGKVFGISFSVFLSRCIRLGGDVLLSEFSNYGERCVGMPTPKPMFGAHLPQFF